MRGRASILVVGTALAGLAMAGFETIITGDVISSVRARDWDDRGEASVRGIHHPQDRARRRNRPIPTPGIRSIDGSGNNLADEEMGAAATQLRRITDSYYEGGAWKPAGAHRPSARAVSNAVADQEGSIPNKLGASDWLWQWGQFLDHDIDLTDAHLPKEPFPIQVPADDPLFDPSGTGTKVISLNRSIWDLTTGTGPDNPRQQINEISAWIDASNVYGSDVARGAALRTNDGTGRLKTSAGNLLPFNIDVPPLPNAGGSSPGLFLAGDVRANEQAGLTAVHTLFVREHNRLADSYRAHHPRWSGERIYQKARRMVGAFMQAITFNEFLPTLLGPHAIPRYRGYDSRVDARISNEFSTSAYRFGHSALNTTLLRFDSDGNKIAEGHLALREAFFAPHRIIDEGGIDPLLRGLSFQYAQTIDPLIVDDVRNFLFGEPGADVIMPGLDLAALNIQRGRDHGLPSYNDMRAAMGLPRAGSFADISSNRQTRERLAAVYDNVDDVDMWIGGLSEDAVRGAHVGRLFYKIIRNQFIYLRDGDRFWYERVLDPHELHEVRRTRLSDIIRRNTGIRNEIPSNVFRVPHVGLGKNHK
jgi:hypothetical protein